MAGGPAARDASWLSFPRAAFAILVFYLLLTCLWFQNWYAVWPLALAALFPPGYEVRLAVLLGYAGLAKPLIFEPLWLWQRPCRLRCGASCVWGRRCWPFPGFTPCMHG